MQFLPTIGNRQLTTDNRQLTTDNQQPTSPHFRQLPLPAYRKYSEDDYKNNGNNHRDFVSHTEGAQTEIQNRSRKAGGSIDCSAKNERNDIAQNITHHPAKAGGHRAHNHRHRRVQPECQRLFQTQNRKQPDAYRVEHKHGFPQFLNIFAKEKTQRNGNTDKDKIIGIRHPTDGCAADEHIAQRTAADRRDKGDDRRPENVEFLLGRRQNTADSKNKSTDEVYGVNKIHGVES